ncbi:MAG: N-acetylmuramic acid 6-phosphate etherase [Schleiferilactobacillus harbinensis]|jgi:N-acetylmuramic acid 6-phosphate etherase|nr:N-acetylmuramic acid 6-phosphate etherase [Schleiferilactobacillus harbinensis]MCI1911974.1 N-acetylmuramic acid 6-phosphate etherase [Schleiferilactobacillus harbinensis]
MKYVTESRNPATLHIDTMTTTEILRTINAEDQKVAPALSDPRTITTLGKIADHMASVYQSGHHTYYIGAGTSGRLGILDAVELVPTYGITGTEIEGLIAGGSRAMYVAVEGAEDSAELAVHDLQEKQLTAADMVIGIAASGRTPYVIGGLDYARSLGAKTASIACNPDALVSPHADWPVEIVVGPEVVTGSTRMKAGTAQKLALNMLSTTAMIKSGKVYGNLMVDLKPTNEKLVDRAKRIIQEATGASAVESAQAYAAADKSPQVAIVMLAAHVPAATAKAALAQHQGRVALAIAGIQQ